MIVIDGASSLYLQHPDPLRTAFVRDRDPASEAPKPSIPPHRPAYTASATANPPASASPLCSLLAMESSFFHTLHYSIRPLLKRAVAHQTVGSRRNIAPHHPLQPLVPKKCNPLCFLPQILLRMNQAPALLLSLFCFHVSAMHKDSIDFKREQHSTNCYALTRIQSPVKGAVR
jgi:hypothetical protein